MGQFCRIVPPSGTTELVRNDAFTDRLRPSHTGVRFDTVTRGRSKSHAPGISVRKRRQASASVRDRTFPGGHRVTFRGNRVHPSAAANQLPVQKFVAKRGCPREPNHP